MKALQYTEDTAEFKARTEWSCINNLSNSIREE